MKHYNILIKNIYTDEKRTLSEELPDAEDVRSVHKNAMKQISVEEDIECIKTDNKLVYTIDRGFLV